MANLNLSPSRWVLEHALQTLCFLSLHSALPLLSALQKYSPYFITLRALLTQGPTQALTIHLTLSLSLPLFNNIKDDKSKLKTCIFL